MKDSTDGVVYGFFIQKYVVLDIDSHLHTLSAIPCGIKFPQVSISRIADLLCLAGTNFREFGFQTACFEK